MIVETGPGGHLLVVNNLADVPSPSTALSNLGGLVRGDTGWTNVSSFSGTWVATAGFTVRYMKVGQMVKLSGVITGGSVGTAAFTLPSGYRPSQQVGFAVSAGNAFGLVEVNTSGTVVPAIGSGTNVFLDPVFFSTL